MSIILSPHAIKFEAIGRSFALDIYNDGLVYEGVAVQLFTETRPAEWTRHYWEMTPILYVTQATIDEAGGIEAMCQKIVALVNEAFRTLFAAAVPPAGLPHELVLAELRKRLTVTAVGGVPVVRI